MCVWKETQRGTERDKKTEAKNMILENLTTRDVSVQDLGYRDDYTPRSNKSSGPHKPINR